MDQNQEFQLNGQTYQINKKIGEGGQGSAYIVFHKEDNKLLVAKFVQVTRYNPLRSLMNEVECLQRISEKLDCKKYFLCFIDAGEVVFKNSSYLVILTDFLEGYITLKEYKERYDINKKLVAKVNEQIDYAVKLLDSIGVVQGDLTESNIMIDPKTMHVRIIDFGFCDFTD
jgi:serine/threonine protein kinase